MLGTTDPVCFGRGKSHSFSSRVRRGGLEAGFRAWARARIPSSSGRLLLSVRFDADVLTFHPDSFRAVFLKTGFLGTCFRMVFLKTGFLRTGFRIVLRKTGFFFSLFRLTVRPMLSSPIFLKPLGRWYNDRGSTRATRAQSTHKSRCRSGT